MKTYISGKITGLEEGQAEKKFSDAKARLARMGHEPVNPFDLKLEPRREKESAEDFWRRAMLVDIKALFECEAIYMLNNWHESKGAKIERAIAGHMGLTIFFQVA